MRWEDLPEETKLNREANIYIRGLKKRVAVLEQKLLSIRECTNLFDRGQTVSVGGKNSRMKKRIDALEAKLLVIRELSSMCVANEQKGDTRRQYPESRIRRNGVRVKACEAGPHANLNEDLGLEGIRK